MHDNLNSLFKLTPNHVKEAIKVAGSAFEDDFIMVYNYPYEQDEDTITMSIKTPNSEF